jgi:predicted ATPase
LRVHPRHADFGTRRQLAHQPVQRPQPGAVQHRPQPWLDDSQHVGGIAADRSRRAVGQVDHQQQHAVPPLERLRRQQPTEQRVRLGHYPHLTRQDSTQLLQSVAFTVGVGKTFLANALGHIAVRRGHSVHTERADKLFKRLKAARLDNTLDYEMRRLATAELLIIDDLALQPLDGTSTTDFYELCVERHQKAATIVTSNRTPDEWLTMMADPLLAQSAVDRLVSTAHELIIEGPSYRQRQKPAINGRPAGVPVDDQKGHQP